MSAFWDDESEAEMKKGTKVRTAFGEYRIVAQRGEGGAGRVFEAVDDKGEVVAIKVLDPSKTTPEKLRRFKNEFVWLSRVIHENVVRALDSGLTAEGTPFFVMPLFAASLRSVMPTLKPAQVLPLFTKVLSGVEAAHMSSVVHRDLKPENILVNGGGRDVVVADFGIAHFEADELLTAMETRSDAKLANFQYAAPEQRARGRAVDSRADMYALGLILNEMFTGELAIGKGEKRIAQVAPEFGYLDAVVDGMTQNDPERRPSTIDAIKLDISVRSNESAARQKYDELSKTVVSSETSLDPLVREPLEVVSVDYSDGKLVLDLNHQVTGAWQRAFKNMGSFQFSSVLHPDMVRFNGAKALVPTAPGFAEDALKKAKTWLNQANRKYAEDVAAEQRKKEAAQRAELEYQLREEQARAEVLARIRGG